MAPRAAAGMLPAARRFAAGIMLVWLVATHGRRVPGTPAATHPTIRVGRARESRSRQQWLIDDPLADELGQKINDIGFWMQK
ncbi:hypothetical protein ACVCAH_17720 [Micromonospora sp. LZ34]